MNNPNELSGGGVTAVFPSSILNLLPNTLFAGNKAWGAMTQLAKYNKNISFRHFVFGVGVSTSGPSFFQVGIRNNSFAEIDSYSTPYQPVDQVLSGVQQTLQPYLNGLQGVLFDSIDRLSAGSDSFLSTLAGLN